MLLTLLLAVSSSGVMDRALSVAGATGQSLAGSLRQLAEDRPDLQVRYAEAAREVTNWRQEALNDLDPLPISALAIMLNVERPVVTRCVKLNNYWCIKRARWNGEIGADEEGHVGFASAENGADAAVRLLRRYYLEFGRKSALDIVRHWAPAECRVVTGSGGTSQLAVRGIGGTLRARYLARRGKASKPVRVSAILPRQVASFRVPDIASGMGERQSETSSATSPIKAVPTRQIRMPEAAPSAPPRPTAVCNGDEQRIRNYARRMVDGLAMGPGDDLKLFDPDGTPLPNLPKVLLAMSSFELGYLRASVNLVEEAIERVASRSTSGEDVTREPDRLER